VAAALGGFASERYDRHHDTAGGEEEDLRSVKCVTVYTEIFTVNCTLQISQKHQQKNGSGHATG